MRSVLRFVVGLVATLLCIPVAWADVDVVTLDGSGRTIAAPTSWDESRDIEIRINSVVDCQALRLTYAWFDDVKEPEPLAPLATAMSPTSGCGNPLVQPAFRIARKGAKGRMLMYTLWRLVDADANLGQAGVDLNTALAALNQTTSPWLVTNATLDDLLKQAVQLDAATIARLDAEIALHERDLTALDGDAKLFAGTSDPAGIQRLGAILVEIRTLRTTLNGKQGERTTSTKHRQELEAIRPKVSAHQTAVGDLQGSCPRAEIRKVGGLLPFERSRTVYYNFSAIEAPPGYALFLMSGYPRVTEDDRLFALIANRRLRDHKYSFLLSATRQITAPPLLAPVRPSFDVTKLAVPGVNTLMLGVDDAIVKSPCGPRVPIVAASAETAFRDSILPFQDRFQGNDQLTVSISTYLANLTTDKTTTKVDKGVTTVTKESLVEGKSVNLLDQIKYPQVRALYRFNVAIGPMVSDLREPVLTRVKTAANDPDTATVDEARYKTEVFRGDRRVVPTLLFSTYIKRVDIQDPVWAKRARGWWLPGWRMLPAPALGFGLINPTDNAFLGGTAEVFENVHLFVGVHNGKVAVEVKPTDAEGAPLSVDRAERDSQDPKTRPERRWDLAYGATFNINVFGAIFK